MIGQVITDPATGKPSKEFANKLSKSAYQPTGDVKELWMRIQRDYQVAFNLQHKSLREFDGYSLLQRAKLDQETFAAFVGVEYVPAHKRWRWNGRKNTARNKLIGILARMLSGMLYPFVSARNERNEEDKLTARVMRILVEEHLKKANYEVKFLFVILSALVNPATYVEIEWVEAMQLIKSKMANGKYKVEEVIDELLSGLNINTIPIDEIMPTDYYSGTGQLQRLPCVLRVRRIPYDEARSKYKGKYYNVEGKDLFSFVEAGQTRIVLSGYEGSQLFDIEWTEADRDYVQEITAYYRSEDLEVKIVGGVLLINEEDPYNSNPFSHRRMTLIEDEWKTVPILPIAMSGYEPIDPAGRFLFYKSGAFKEYWDDKSLNVMHGLAHDGTFLDVIKVVFMSGVGKADSTVMVPGATVGMPQGATVTPYNLGPNLKAVYENIRQQEQDMSDSTQDKILNGATDPNVSATQTNQAVMQAKINLGVFGLLISDLIRQVGEFTMDNIIAHATVGELDTSVPGELNMKFKTYLAKGKEKGRNITHRISFSSKRMGKKYTQEQVDKKEWEMYEKTGKNHRERYSSDQRIYDVNPYQFARTTYSMGVDVDKILDKSLGATRTRKQTAFNVLTDPRIVEFTDKEAVAEEIIDEFGADLTDDPDKFKRKESAPDDLMNSIAGMMKGGGAPVDTKSPVAGTPMV